MPLVAPPPPTAGMVLPPGFSVQRIATIPKPRELATLPNGDLLVASEDTRLWIVPAVEADAPQSPRVFATIDDPAVAGVTFARSIWTIFVGTRHGVYAIPYRTGDRLARAEPRRIALVRQDVYQETVADHITTSVVYSERERRLFVSIGSTCDACAPDPLRAVIVSMKPDGTDLVVRATHIRNAIALAVDPFDGDVWAGDAGQDELPLLHPYEFFDDLSARAPPADYGWPHCEENRIPYFAGSDCSGMAVPLAVFPAHHTPIGAVFYPFGRRKYGFPLGYRGAAFVTLHGSSRPLTGCYDAPEIVAIPMREGRPAVAVDWSDPRAQLSSFVSGLEPSCLDASQRRARPTGIAVGPDGSLFFSEDLRDGVYRIRV